MLIKIRLPTERLRAENTNEAGNQRSNQRRREKSQGQALSNGEIKQHIASTPGFGPNR
jgi:hypothetical protein